jgi:hypothetical protein
MKHPPADIARKRSLVAMLQLAATAFAEVAARRGHVVRPMVQAAIWQDGISGCRHGHVAASGGDPIAFGSQANDFFSLVHSSDP